jgi:hypothetical protein
LVQLVESKTQVSANRQDGIAIDVLDVSLISSPLVRPD